MPTAVNNGDLTEAVSDRAAKLARAAETARNA